MNNYLHKSLRGFHMYIELKMYMMNRMFPSIQDKTHPQLASYQGKLDRSNHLKLLFLKQVHQNPPLHLTILMDHYMRSSSPRQHDKFYLYIYQHLSLYLLLHNFGMYHYHRFVCYYNKYYHSRFVR